MAKASTKGDLVLKAKPLFVLILWTPKEGYVLNDGSSLQNKIRKDKTNLKITETQKIKLLY